MIKLKILTNCFFSQIIKPSFSTSSSIHDYSIVAAVKRILMNNLQKLEFNRLLDRDICREKVGALPNDALCTEEEHVRNVCMVCFFFFFLK